MNKCLHDYLLHICILSKKKIYLDLKLYNKINKENQCINTEISGILYFI